ncbi:MAG: hypothetical protein WCZ90_01595 [Melioribacteraceae bacterium]
MITFLLILVLVFIGVDLLVRFVIEPLIVGSKKKNKVSKSFTKKFDPAFKLATETMYDGGKPHNQEEMSSATKDEITSTDATKN